jgi:hypothetical protein
MSKPAIISALYLISLVLFTWLSQKGEVIWDCDYHIYEAAIVICGVWYMSLFAKSSLEMPLFYGIMIYKALIILIQVISIVRFSGSNNYHDYRIFMSNHNLLVILTAGILGLIIFIEWIVKRAK